MDGRSKNQNFQMDGRIDKLTTEMGRGKQVKKREERQSSDAEAKPTPVGSMIIDRSLSRCAPLPVANEAAELPVASGAPQELPDAVEVIPVAGGARLPVTRIQFQWIVEHAPPCTNCLDGSMLGWIGHCTASEQRYFALYHKQDPKRGHAVYDRWKRRQERMNN
jgi:hypothetical protein